MMQVLSCMLFRGHGGSSRFNNLSEVMLLKFGETLI